MTFAARRAELLARVAAATAAAGRPPGAVRLLAASKTVPADRLAAAVLDGQTLLGENRAQELRDKRAAFAERRDLPPIEWHFIGPLQKNKVRNVVGEVALIHTVDSLELAEEIGKRRRNLAERGQDPGPVAILVEVNIGGEESKAGVAPGAVLDLCAALAALPDVRLRGLMTIPPWAEDPEAAAPYFEAMSALAREGRARGLPLEELSMGMSDDFEVAIRHGATLVRVGTALFGDRL